MVLALSFSLAARECEGASPEPCYELLTYRQMDGFCYAEVLGGADFIASAGGVPFAPQEWPGLSEAGSYIVDGVEYMYRYWTVDGEPYSASERQSVIADLKASFCRV